jgi:hypothetical protein
MAAERTRMTTRASEQDQNPPQWAERLLRRTLSPANRDTITGDLLEEYREVILPARGVVGARRWYLRHALSLMLASNSTVQWLIWLIATAALVIAFVMRYHLGPPFPDAGWAMLAIVAVALFSLRSVNVRLLGSVSLRFGLVFVAVAGTASVGAALLHPLSDTHSVLVAYSGLRGEVLVAGCATVFVAAGFRGAWGCQRVGVGILTAMGTALVGAVSWTVFVTTLARLSPTLIDQLGPLSTFAWAAPPFTVTIVLVHSIGNYFAVVTLSILPGLVGAMLGRAFAGMREQGHSEPLRPATS